MIVERYEDKADAQQATRLKAARHFPQIRKQCSERTLATNYAPKSADACAPFGFGFAESTLHFASAHFPAFPAPCEAHHTAPPAPATSFTLAIVERVVRKSQRLFPYWEHSWAGTAHRSASTRNSASGTREHRLIACQRTSVIYSIVPATMESGGHLHFHCSATVRTPDAISASPQKFSAGGLAHA